jgi:exodeoxyribonuclease V beta subunit
VVVTEPDEFDATAPVEEGITLLEASAGTGKSHAVASLVVAEVAGGRPLDELLVVTFTRKATGTLRERVWLRLTVAAHALDPDAPEPNDLLLVHLRRGSPEEVAARQSNLQRAASDFDAATIATTHGFCQQVLASLGVAGDAERGLEFVDQIGDLVTDAVDDLFVRRFHAGGDVLFDRGTALAIAKMVIGRPDCTIGHVDSNDADLLRRKFATTLRGRIDDQKRRGRIITFDDLLSRLDTSINDEIRGNIVAERLRRRYTMAVVDEFQDTDSVQWGILQKAFGGPPSRLVLVGDPKQAIYAFRGGDVFAYLEATKKAQHRRSLPISWRADQPLLDAQDSLFDGAQLGDASIRHRPVQARPGASTCGLQGPAVGASLTVRIAHRSSDAFTLTEYGWANKPSVRQFIAEDLAAEAVRILNAGTTIGARPVVPGDLAVLTRTHREAEAARDSLHTVGVPAVVHGGSTVLATEAARHWLDLLNALEQPASTTRVHAVALGPFVGWDAARMATATESEWDEVDEAMHDWIAVLLTHGVAGLLRRINTSTDLTARLLSVVGGERRLADLRHIAELLHGRQSTHPGSTAVLAGWLAEQMSDAEDVGVEDVRRRLESDADAVAIHTVHGAKGLEFPIVLLPSLWDAPRIDGKDLAVFHDDDGRRTIGVGGSGPMRDWQVERAAAERDDEELRLLYVSLTRAKHKVVAWWATAFDADRAAFARLLCGRDQASGFVQRKLRRPPDEAAIAAELTKRSIAVEDANGATGERYQPAAEPAADLAVGRFGRGFDRLWVRTSYSGLTRAVHDAEAPAALDLVEVGETAKGDEPVVASGAAPADGALARTLSLGGVPGGARVGTLVHEVLERTEFDAADLPSELSRACDVAGARRILEGHVDALVAGLALAIDTPLGPGWSGTRLRDLRRADRLDEMTFDLPLAGGDHPDNAVVTMHAIAGVFARLPADDPLAGYHEHLRDPRLATAVRGFLTGSIDLVARLGDRHVVIDYKTNLLAPYGATPSAWHYRPAALIDAMQEAHYPLQAALYAVALHRFLRWRLAGYDPVHHLGGVAYLFLRGMTGPEAPTVDGQPCGVFAWHPPATFTTELSDLLDQGVAR